MDDCDCTDGFVCSKHRLIYHGLTVDAELAYALASEKQLIGYLDAQTMRANKFEADNIRLYKVLEIVLQKATSADEDNSSSLRSRLADVRHYVLNGLGR